MLTPCFKRILCVFLYSETPDILLLEYQPSKELSINLAEILDIWFVNQQTTPEIRV